jgi:hypothetical protein
MTGMRPGLSKRVRGWIDGLGPYQSLALVVVPAGIVEPLKLVAVAAAGEGYWFTGTVVIVAAYAASLLLIERLFTMVKPKLLGLHWFSKLWAWFVVVRYKLMKAVRSEG